MGEAIGEWSELQGYALEGQWDASTRRILGVGLEEANDRPVTTLSGGELKRLALDVLFASDASVLLIDEPDNYLDVPAKAWLERLVRESTKTDPDHQPRPGVPQQRPPEDRHPGGLGGLGPRRELRHLSGGAGAAAAGAGRRRRALAGRGAPALPAHEDHEAAGLAERRQRQGGQRRRDPLGDASATRARPRRPPRRARCGPACGAGTRPAGR